MEGIILNNINVEKNKVIYKFSPNEALKKYFNYGNQLFIQYNKDINQVPNSILMIPFLVNVMPILWITDYEMIVEELDEDFYYCLENVKKGFKSMYPNVSFNGQLHVKNLIKNEYDIQKEAAQLFSGGLDAVTTYIRIKEKYPVLITHYNWFEDEIKEDEVWLAEKKIVTDFAEKYELANIFIESNFGTFLNYKALDKDFSKKLNDNWWHGIHHGMAFIGMTAPIMYLMKIKTLYIASSFYEGNPCPCASDPRIDNQIKMASSNVYHDSYEFNRQQKVQIINNYVKKTNDKINLKVCFRTDKNCCNCEKCMRTILGIIIEGGNPKDFGFEIDDNYDFTLKHFLRNEVKFFTKSKILIWSIMRERLKENYEQVSEKWDFEWLLNYDFKKEKKIRLMEYRIKKFFPILIRKIKTRLASNS